MAAAISCFFLYLGVRSKEEGKYNMWKPCQPQWHKATQKFHCPAWKIPAFSRVGWHSLGKFFTLSRLWGYLGHEEDRGTAESTWIAVYVAGTAWALQNSY